MAEGHALGDAINIGRVHHGGLAEPAQAFRIFSLRQVAAAGVGTQDLAGGGDLKPLRRGFFGLNAFGTTHKLFFSQKESRKITVAQAGGKPEFETIPLLRHHVTAACLFQSESRNWTQTVKLKPRTPVPWQKH